MLIAIHELIPQKLRKREVPVVLTQRTGSAGLMKGRDRLLG
jgi:hypothetical protein